MNSPLWKGEFLLLKEEFIDKRTAKGPIKKHQFELFQEYSAP